MAREREGFLQGAVTRLPAAGLLTFGSIWCILSY